MHSLFFCGIKEISISLDVIHLKKKEEYYIKLSFQTLTLADTKYKYQSTLQAFPSGI